MSMKKATAKALKCVEKRQYDKAVKETLQCLTAGGETAAKDYVIAKTVVGALCQADQLGSAVTVLKSCPLDVYGDLKLDQVMNDLLARRRFEMASTAIVEFKVLERQDFGVLDQFLSELLQQQQYKLAMTWTNILSDHPGIPDHLRLTPSVIVEAMKMTKAYGKALGLIDQYGMQCEFPVEDLVDSLVAERNFKEAVTYMRKFKLLGTRYNPKDLVEGMLEAKCWNEAVTLVRMSKTEFPQMKLGEIYTPVVLIERMIQAHDWQTVTFYINMFAFTSKEPAQKKVLVKFVGELVSTGELFKAMKYVKEHDLETEFPREKMISTMIELGQHQHAIYFMKKYELEDKFTNKLKKVHAERLSALKVHRNLMKHKTAAMKPSADRVVVQELVWLVESSIVSTLDDPRDKKLLREGPGEEEKETSNDAHTITTASQEEPEEDIVLLAKPGTPASSSGARSQKGADAKHKKSTKSSNSKNNNKTNNRQRKVKPDSLKPENVQILKRSNAPNSSGTPPVAFQAKQGQKNRNATRQHRDIAQPSSYRPTRQKPSYVPGVKKFNVKSQEQFPSLGSTGKTEITESAPVDQEYLPPSPPLEKEPAPVATPMLKPSQVLLRKKKKSNKLSSVK